MPRHPTARRRSCRALVWALALACLALAAAGCSQSPQDAYYEMVAAAKMGDQDGFLEAFTAESRPLVEALLKLSDIYGLERTSPYTLLVHTEVLEVEEPPADTEKAATDDRPVAVIVVRVGKTGRRRIKMVKEEGAWRIDALDLERFWQEDRTNFRF